MPPLAVDVALTTVLTTYKNEHAHFSPLTAVTRHSCVTAYPEGEGWRENQDTLLPMLQVWLHLSQEIQQTVDQKLLHQDGYMGTTDSGVVPEMNNPSRPQWPTEAQSRLHWTEGGTGITNFDPKWLPIYERAIAEWGDTGIIISSMPIEGRYKPFPGDMSLHVKGMPRDLSGFWEVFHRIERDTVIELEA